jgi:hypothetical protein
MPVGKASYVNYVPVLHVGLISALPSLMYQRVLLSNVQLNLRVSSAASLGAKVFHPVSLVPATVMTRRVDRPYRDQRLCIGNKAFSKKHFIWAIVFF